MRGLSYWSYPVVDPDLFPHPHSFCNICPMITLQLSPLSVQFPCMLFQWIVHVWVSVT